MSGKRKVVFGAYCIGLLWIAYMWAPAISDVQRTGILNLMAIVVGLVVGGNAFEYLMKRKESLT